jgi:hypothetical protein
MTEPSPTTEPSKVYELAVTCTSAVDAAALATTVVDAVTVDGTVDSVDAFVARLDVADLRSRVVLVVEAAGTREYMLYAALTGLAGRHVDVAFGDGVVHGSRVWNSGREARDAGRLADRVELCIAGPEPLDGAAFVLLRGLEDLGALGAEDVAVLRRSRSVHVTLSDDPGVGFVQLAYIAGIRRFKDRERLPALRTGDGTVVDLDELRRLGADRRRQQRDPDQLAIADVVEATDRQRRLRAAAAVPVTDVLAAFGSTADDSGELWQCPRPWSHTHGDATPSMRARGDNTVRCFVDDAEWIDPVRLVMGTCGLSPDDAADLLLGDLARLAPWRQLILTERARRSAA